MAEFKSAYKKTGGFEGGYVDDKVDRGGITYCGVAKNFHPNWEGWVKLKSFYPLKKGQIIHDPEIEGLVANFYKREFWDKLRGDMITDQAIAEQLYDRAVNFGIKEAIRQSQAALGIEQTGKMDEATFAAINDPDKHLLA